MKKMLGLITIYILMLASNVYATNDHNDHEDNDSSYISGGNGGNGGAGGQGGQGFGGNGGAAYSGAVGIGAATSGANSYSGASVSGTNSNSASIGRIVNQGATSTYNQTQQTPFAYAPSTNVGSGKYRCNDGASLGVSSGFGAISGGMPVTDELCQQLVMADWLADHNLMQEACEMMLMDERVAEVFKKTGRTCKPTVVAPAHAYVAPKFIDPDQDYKLKSIFKNR